MKSIDVHTHILPPELPRWGRGLIRMERVDDGHARMLRDDGTLFREVESNVWDPARRLRECDAAGIDVQVISTVPVFFAYDAPPALGLDVARFLNDHIASVCGDRLIGL